MIESEGSQSAAKIGKFEIDVSISNAWNFPISMVEYLNKCIHIHIPDKDIKEKILKDNPSLPMSRNPRFLTTILKNF